MEGAQLVTTLAFFGMLRLMLPLHAALCMLYTRKQQY